MSLPLTRLWSRIEPILDAVVDLPEPVRSAKALAMCADDPELGTAVARLLRADSAAGDFLGVPLVVGFDPDETFAESDGAARDVDRIGPFRIVRELGRGGMGRVLLGERDDGQFEQRVAIKILHGDLTAGADRETILRERRILARLEHPRIARMYDGGVTDSGEPYFVMEHVDGLALDAYCEKERPPLSRRLELFREICRAVEFAHGRFIVHCDIKPRNVLVTADGDVKLLDFGIAGLVEEESQGRGQRVRSFTPAYAAPEQIHGERVTAATDVYQLGLVLKGLVGDDVVPADLQAIVAKALRADPGARYATAEALRRDLEDFLQGRPVAAFDGTTGYRVKKWMGRYRLAVGATAAIVGVLALGLIGVGLSARATARARDRAATAERRVSAVNEFVLHELLEAPMPEVAMGRNLTVAEVLGNASRSVEHAFQGQPAAEAEVRLTLAHTYAALGRSKEATEHARAAKLLLAGSPDLAPGLLDRSERTLASLAIDDGRFEEARIALEALHERQVAARGPSDEEALWTSAELGRALKGKIELVRAEQVLRDAAELARRDHPDDWRLEIEIDRTLSDVLALGSQANESEALARSVLDTMGRHLGVDHPERVRALMQLSAALNQELRYPEAAEATEEALTLSRKVFGNDHPMTAEVLSWKMLAQERLSRYDEAMTAGKEAFDIRRKALGPDNPKTVASLYGLGVLTANAGHLDEAVTIFVDVIDRRAAVLGESHAETVRAMKSLNLAYLNLEREADARAVAERMTRAYEAATAPADADPERIDAFAQHLMVIQPKDLRDPKRALALAERAVAATNRTRWNLLRTLGDAYGDTGRNDLAIHTMEEALALPDGLRSWSTVEEVVDLLRDEKRDVEIEPFLLAHRDRQLSAPRPDERMVAKTERVLALHLVGAGRAKDADPYFAEAERRLRRVVPAGNWEIGRLLSDWGACRAELREYPEAERLLLDAYEIVSADREMRKATAATRGRLVKLYEAWGRPADAAKWK